MNNSPKTALLILASGVEEVEAVTPIDLLRRSGIEVTVAAISADRRVVGRTKIALEADTSLSEAMLKDYDVVVVPGGPGVKLLRATADVITIVKKQAASGRLVAAICAAPTLLKDAGVLQGRKYTAHFSVEAELPEIDRTKAVVHDGNIITSRGAGTAIPFALEIIVDLLGADAAQKVADSICYPH